MSPGRLQLFNFIHRSFSLLLILLLVFVASVRAKDTSLESKNLTLRVTHPLEVLPGIQRNKLQLRLQTSRIFPLNEAWTQARRSITLQRSAGECRSPFRNSTAFTAPKSSRPNSSARADWLVTTLGRPSEDDKQDLMYYSERLPLLGPQIQRITRTMEAHPRFTRVLQEVITHADPQF